MTPIREQLRDKVRERLEQIRIGNTVVVQSTGRQHAFLTDIGTSVIPWRIGDVLPEEMPCAGFADQEAPAGFDGASHGEQAHGLAIEIVGFVAQEGATSEQMASLATGVLMDILSAIGADPEWDGLASAMTTLLATEIELHPDGRGVAAGIVRVRIDYFSPLWEV